MKRFFLVLLMAIVLVIVIVLFKTFAFKSQQLNFPASQASEPSENAVQHLSESIKFKTISYGDSARLDTAAFFGFHRFLQRTYPLVYSKLILKAVAKYSLLFQWPGSGTELKPVVFMAHQDVVPVEEAAASLWTVEPFAGTVKDGSIWGRGTADDKINLIAMLETVEALLAKGYTPKRTLYLCFGHDEEMGGYGAAEMAKLLVEAGVQPDLVLDEGGIVTREKVPGMKKAVALIGTSEKGYMTVSLSVEKNGGHSSMPETETSIDILTKAIVRLREHPFESRFSPSTEGFMRNLGPEMPFVNRMAFANPWLFTPMIKGIYEQSAGGNAMIRTTLVPTILDAGVKDNVIPTRAEASVNVRLLPGDSSGTVLALIREIVGDERVRIALQSQFVHEPSAVTDETSYAYQVVNEAAKRSFDNVITSPFLMIGATDSRHFAKVSSGIIKFSPMIDPEGFHGIDERVSLEGYGRALLFYDQLISIINK
ncbi:MAG: M20 family peptidase [Chryseolinea sp.]